MWQLAVWVRPTVTNSPYDAPVSNFLESVGTTVEGRFPGIHWIVDDLNFACPTLIIWDWTYGNSKAGLDRMNEIEAELQENLAGIETSVYEGEFR